MRYLPTTSSRHRQTYWLHDSRAQRRDGRGPHKKTNYWLGLSRSTGTMIIGSESRSASLDGRTKPAGSVGCTLCRRNVKKTAWTAEEDRVLLEQYHVHAGKWAAIAKHIPGRTDDACSKRYREALDPMLKKGEWTAEEDRAIDGGVQGTRRTMGTSRATVATQWTWLP
ncbi:Homeodomain-like protein [Pisolithus croceorrhizus]|nr:Homeodomain-like protein [Pisolithus croceorrhizus]